MIGAGYVWVDVGSIEIYMSNFLLIDCNEH